MDIAAVGIKDRDDKAPESRVKSRDSRPNHHEPPGDDATVRAATTSMPLAGPNTTKGSVRTTVRS